MSNGLSHRLSLVLGHLIGHCVQERSHLPLLRLDTEIDPSGERSRFVAGEIRPDTGRLIEVHKQAGSEAFGRLEDEPRWTRSSNSGVGDA